MKAKTIKLVLRQKFDAFLKSIEDEELREAVRKGGIVSGGAIVSMLQGEEVNDYDIWFNSKELARRVAVYYVEQFKKNPPSRMKTGDDLPITVVETDTQVRIMVKSAGVASGIAQDDYQYFETLPDGDDYRPAEYIEKTLAALNEDLEGEGDVGTFSKEDKPEGEPKKPSSGKFKPLFLSSNAISLSDRFQLVTRFFGEPEDILKTFDFAHAMSWWKSGTNELYLDKLALECILAKELVYKGSLYPLCSIIRARKFLLRGWSINAGQYLKMIMQLQELDLNDHKVLEDQLLGMDTAYFVEILAKLRSRDPKEVDTTYLVELIDRMF